jgi:hypothetical protein
MSRHWSEPLDDYTQELSVLDVPHELVQCLSSDILSSIRRIHEAQEEKHRVAAKFLSSVDRVLLREDAHVVLCVPHQNDSEGERCCNAVDVCSLLLRELRTRQLTAQDGISLAIKPWLDIAGGSEFQVFVIESTIKGTRPEPPQF